MSIIATKGRLIVEEIIEDNKTSGGIILTGTTDPEKTARIGIIKSNGVLNGEHEDNNYKAGLKVYFGKYAGTNINHKGSKYVSLLESEVCAITV